MVVICLMKDETNHTTDVVLPGKGDEGGKFSGDICSVDEVMVSRLLAEVEWLRSENLSLTSENRSLISDNLSLTSDNLSLASDKILLAKEVEELRRTEEKLQLQILWLARMVFGQKTERRMSGEEQESISVNCSSEITLDEPPPATETVRKYAERSERSLKNRGKKNSDHLLSKLSADPSVKKFEIVETPDEIKGLTEGIHYRVISSKITHKIAIEPRRYTLLIIKRPVVKFISDTDSGESKGDIVVAPIPGEVIERSVADVSFLASLLVQKFVYHMPLYRVHDMITRSGFHIARSTLARMVISVSDLISPVYYSLLSSIVQSEVLSMDEVPCRVGLDPDRPGKMNTAYFWPLYGDKNEVAFPYANSREHAHVGNILKDYCGTLVSDGYAAYTAYVAKRNGAVIHAGCWFHWRREFLKAENLHKELANKFLSIIRKLAEIERRTKSEKLSLDQLMELRSTESRPLVDQIFALGREVLAKEAITPTDPLRKAIEYGLSREAQLRVFLTEPRVPMSTNEIERLLRPIPMGRKAWLFCWEEVGGIALGRILSLVATCQLHGVDPYTYFVDVLQRIRTHRIRDVHLLTPRLWKDNFADNPILAPIDKYYRDRQSTQTG